ncbi:MAG TPA: cytochrome P450 [Myxococcales bacterium]|nr:cytochrome P450 [Deltaproteobacteria bacterium]MBU53699.1 cytochrome P450 [Deltaproteobacteria bacterium]HAA57052.1 cytochrome P450 [Myxococcales bacterium]|tara:strand:- start:12044 stop:13255 length:1212 start_codon:yes stop_codon:yes gene_type:complete
MQADWTPKHPINISAKAFIDDKYKYYDWMRREAPVYRGKFGPFRSYLLCRYEDCDFVLRDPRFIRSRKENKWRWLMPYGIKLITESMIYQDGDEHRRLRNLVQKAFTPKAITKMHDRIEVICNELLDEVEATHDGHFDLVPTYAFPLPVRVIGELLGIEDNDMDSFQKSVDVLLEGLTGIKIVKTLVWDLPKTVSFLKELLKKKRATPADDLLTALIQAEENGDTLTEDELLGMMMILIIAGYETTVDLIKCAVVALLTHPEQLQMLKEDDSLMDGTIEEVLRYWGPVHGTELIYASEDIQVGDVTIPKGHIITPLLGAANRDPDKFEHPEAFDITRTANRHLGFGKGIHYCLGAPLARLEAKIALRILFSRFPQLTLTKPLEELTFKQVPLFHRFKEVPLSY